MKKTTLTGWAAATLLFSASSCFISNKASELVDSNKQKEKCACALEVLGRRFQEEQRAPQEVEKLIANSEVENPASLQETARLAFDAKDSLQEVRKICQKDPQKAQKNIAAIMVILDQDVEDDTTEGPTPSGSSAITPTLNPQPIP